MDLNSMSVEELKALVVKSNEVLEAKQAQTAKTRVAEVLQSKAGQKLLADYTAAMAVVNRYKEAKTVKVKMLLQVDLEAVVTLDQYNLNNDNFDSLFEIEVNGTVKKTRGLTDDQISTLNYGLRETLAHACEDKMDLFPLLKEELEGAQEELEEIGEALFKHSLTLSDLDGFIATKPKTPVAKKKKK